MKQLLVFTLCALVSGLMSCSSKPDSKSEKPKADTLTFTMAEKTRTYQNCSPYSTDCTSIRFSYPKFSQLTGPLGDSVRVLIARTFAIDSGSEAEMDSSQLAFIKEYSDLMTSEEEGPTVPWFLQTGLSVEGQTTRWICLDEVSSGYTGGAHDFGFSQYHILEKATGRQLHLADFFDSTGLKKLTRLGEIEFCIERGIKDNVTFEEAGFNFKNERFFLPENFSFKENGMEFIFNSYEVGPYVLGPTVFVIPANKIVGLMRKPETKK
ncbi:MAG TPA: DUF3298 domain-containing protein [Catalimonadaceae bacterium]|nr:DUF3298 domain-containing protein [Catalimonadaceae bacterium]